MKKNWNNLEIFHQSIVVSIIYSIMTILISLILLLVDTSWIYGSLIGIALLFLSYFIIWVIWYKIPKFEKLLTILLPIFVPLIRIILFVPVLICIILLINIGEGIDKVLYPVNVFSFLITYSISMISYFTIGFAEMFKKKEV